MSLVEKMFFLFMLLLIIPSCRQANSSNVIKNSNRYKPLSLKILHINDHHDRLEVGKRLLTIAGIPVQVDTGGASQLVQAFKLLEQQSSNVLKLHAGDALMSHGTEVGWFAFKGAADADLISHICFDAFTLGNHEFDNNEKGLKLFIDQIRKNPNCQTKLLSANFKQVVGSSPLALKHSSEYIQTYMVKEFSGNKVAVIGLTTTDVPSTDTRMNNSNEFLSVVDTAQALINELKIREQIHHFVLLTHIGIEEDILLAQKLTDVDVIVGGHSHTLLGKQLTPFGYEPQGDYPTIVKNKETHNVCIVHASAYGKIIGELNVEFDETGNVLSCKGLPHVVISGQMQKKVSDQKFIALTTEESQKINQAIEESGNVLLNSSNDVSFQKVFSLYKTQMDTLKSTIIGEAKTVLCLERAPLQGISELDGCKEQTRLHGSDVTQLVVQSFLAADKLADFSLINAGDIRSDLKKGRIRLIDAYSILPFSNDLVEISLSGLQVKNLLEDVLAYSRKLARAYPYASGLRWRADMKQTKGNIASQIEVKDDKTLQWLPLQDSQIYKMVTTDYVALGQKGYTLLATLPKKQLNVVALDALIDYIKELTQNGQLIDLLPYSEYSTQHYIAK